MNEQTIEQTKGWPERKRRERERESDHEEIDLINNRGND